MAQVVTAVEKEDKAGKQPWMRLCYNPIYSTTINHTSMTSNHSSSPIKPGHSPSGKALDAAKLLRDTGAVTEVPYDDFLTNYLPTRCEQPQGELSWDQRQQELVQNIRAVQPGNEKKLYTDSAPLLCLCNTTSKRIFDSLPVVDRPQTVPVFYYSHEKRLVNPFSGSLLAPDIVVVYEKLESLERLIVLPDLKPPSHNWSSIAAVGEVKVDKDATYQTANYLWNQLQLRPDLHSVIGFSADSSKVEWTPGPLHAFIRQLYQGTPRDTSIINLTPMDLKPSWCFKIDDDIFVTIGATPDPGLGQRRFTAIVKHAQTGARWFIKDIYRDTGRRFFEGTLYDKAHSGQILPGLMYADHHGYVLDENKKVFKTASSQQADEEREPTYRSKMRVATQDVGQALSEAQTLGEFLAVMYDVCVVQRNLYRKSKILHRDISDNNIMIAPKDDKRFHGRCDGGYDEVKYLNQVLTLAKEPRPACLVIDLGNGADLESPSIDPELLAKRTGTPKFIARSVSKGRLLYLNSSDVVTMPRLTGESLQLYTACGDSEYEEYNRSVDDGFPQDPDGAKFAHQLFHDAESTFWVIAWFLARAAPKAYQKETQWNPEFRRFVNGMKSHRPASDDPDPRSDFYPVPEYWKEILHPELASMAPMLSAMHKYILPEWGYRPELDAEHAHQALMRLLLAEIVRIRDKKADIEFAPGIRALPLPAPSTKSKLTSSISNTLTTASSLSAPVNKKRSRSQEDDGTESDVGLRPSPRLAQLKLDDTGETIKTLREKARGYPWFQRQTWLKRPECGPSTNTAL
ncbi:unnamed protein product [Rhizoctonia solani]|uniref:Fungal-type protein kinase domain-containing protein n=1 Tax=Rhizoctonia solani TaxID=456999 RepID=A0A8H3D902_9AGAM|nr:unnamed protein product [Rhizoctonia solani]